MQYRAELDGLRALAVLAVILFHLEVEALSGGYVGVDVFFVLSGYLITGVILAGLKRENFRLGDFYLRRVRRLFPAALFTIVATTVVSILSLPHTALKAYGRSVVFSVVSLGNFHFWSESGYFDSDSGMKPLLHLWSLGVEEQFYLVWPGVLVLLFRSSFEFGNRRRRVLPLAVLLLGALSFCGALLSMQEASDNAFFLPHLRGWEFSIGAALAAREVFHSARTQSSNLLLVLGLTLILGPCFFYEPDLTFPGLSALPPCLGTALVIAAGAPARLGKLLTNPVSVFVGKTSYSSYLVHWPLLVLYRQHTFRDFSLAEQGGLFVATFVIATLLWRYVETPFRVKGTERPPISGRGFVALSASATLAVAAAGGWLWLVDKKQQVENRDSQELLAYVERANDLAFERTLRDVCYLTKKGKLDHKRCLAPSKTLPNILLVGDSHAANWYPAFKAHFAERAHVSLSSVMSCRPLLSPTSGYPACEARNTELFERADLSVYDAVVVTGAFYKKAEFSKLPRALEKLRKRGARHVFLLGAPMSYKVSVGATFARFSGETTAEIYGHLGEQLMDRFLESDGPLRKAAKRSGVPYLSLVEVLCPTLQKKQCLHSVPGLGTPFVRDTKHVTQEGGVWLLRQWEGQGVPFRAALRGD